MARLSISCKLSKASLVYFFSFFCYCTVLSSNCTEAFSCSLYHAPILSKIQHSYSEQSNPNRLCDRTLQVITTLQVFYSFSSFAIALSLSLIAYPEQARFQPPVLPNPSVNNPLQQPNSMIWAMGFVTAFFKPAGQLLLLQALDMLVIHVVFVLESRRIGRR